MGPLPGRASRAFAAIALVAGLSGVARSQDEPSTPLPPLPGETVPAPRTPRAGPANDSPIQVARRSSADRAPGDRSGFEDLTLDVTPPFSKEIELPSIYRPAAVYRGREGIPSPLLEPVLNRVLGVDPARIKLFGWIENSFTGNPSQPADGLNFGVHPNNLANRWMGNQYYLVVEHKVEQNDMVNLGWRVDNLFGNDWLFNHMHGLFDTSFTPNHFAGYDPAQIYGEIHLPILTEKGLDIRGGRWYTIVGYEGVATITRPLLSVPYMFYYGQPFTHFGLLSTLYLSDRVQLFNGTVNGWDRWIDRQYKWGYIGGIAWDSRDRRTNLAISMVWGPNQFPRFLPANTQIVPTGATPPPFLAGRRNLGYGGNDRTLFTTVLLHKWSENLTQILETDQGFEANVPGLGRGGTAQNAEWYSFGNWFLYHLTDNVTGVWRSEVFRDDDGARTGFADTFYEMTLGAIYRPDPHLWIRPEVRYDWAQFTHPYNGGQSGSQFTLAMDVIVLF